VRHLLTHTAGLPGLEENFKALWPGGLRTNYTTAQLFDAATKDALSFPATSARLCSPSGSVLCRASPSWHATTRYYSFWLTSDGRVATFLSTME
jgi:hypothetical protein